jgi:hypothetical protein
MALAVFATVGGAMVATDPAFAKTDVDKLTIGGEARVRYEIRTNGDFGATGAGNLGQSNVSYASHRIRVGVGYDLTPDVSFFAQLQDARIWGSEAGQGAALTGTGIGAVSSANQNSTGVDLHQGYILVKNLLVPGLSLKAGRQEIIYGDHRLFGNFGWSQIGNSFDAVKLSHSSQMADVDLFWARIIDTEGQALANTSGGAPLFSAAGAKGTNDQDIYGLYVTLKPIANWTIEPYYFLLADHRAPAVTAFNAPQASSQSRSTVGGRLNGKAGGLDATAELAWQFGSISDNLAAGSPTSNLHINAWAGAAKAGYTMDAVPMKPRIGVEVDYASGDGCVAGGAAACRTQGKLGTFDNLYPTNHFHYGYMDLMAWRNMVNYQIMFDVKPSPVSKLQANFIIHRLARTHDNWYRAGQVTYGTTGAANTAASIGRELDIHYWHTLKEKFKFEIGYGHFWAGDYIANAARNGNTVLGVTPTSASGQNWGYVMGSVLF